MASDLIRSDQMATELIKSHQRSTESVKSYQISADLIRTHQNPSNLQRIGARCWQETSLTTHSIPIAFWDDPLILLVMLRRAWRMVAFTDLRIDLIRSHPLSSDLYQNSSDPVRSHQISSELSESHQSSSDTTRSC